MDQEQLNEFYEKLQELNETLSSTGQSGDALSQQMRQQVNAIKSQLSAVLDSTKATKDQTATAKDFNKFQEANVKSSKEFDKALKSLSSAATQAGGALGSMTLAALSTERNFSKYGDALGGAGDAAMELGENFGALGKAAGLAVKGLTFVGQKSLEQADNVVNATDSLRKMGGAGEYTSEEFLKLAHNAGVTSKNLDLLVKPLENLESTVLGLGTAAGEGIQAFAEISAVSSEQRKEFRRLGISQDELIESQAAYLELQNATGSRMRRTGETEEQRIRRLQKESLNYTRNLSELAALTGKDVDVLKKEQQAALAREEFMVQNAQTEQEINELRKQGRDAEADALQKELDTRDKFVTEISTRVGDADLDTAIMQMISSGGAVFTEETAALARSLGIVGEDFNRFMEGIEAGDEGIIDEFLETLKESTNKSVDQLGQAAILGGAEVRSAFGISAERMQFAARRAGEDEEDARRETTENIRKAAGAGFDPAMDARAQLTEMEISASVALDDLLAKVNPLIGGFTATTVAAGAAAVALSGLAASSLFKGLGGLGGKGLMSGAAGGAKAIGGKMLGAKMSSLSGVGLRAAGGAGILGAGMGAYQAYSEGKERRADIRAREEAGVLDEYDASAARRASVAKTAGQSAGTTAGALAGGAKGAAMGAVLGPIGATVGGLIGAGIGAWAGKQGGKLVGGAIGEGIGESVKEQDFSEEIKKDQATLDAMKLAGAGDEEIAHMEKQLELNRQLAQAQEAQDYELMNHLQIQKELNDARLNGTDEEIQQLEKLAEKEREASTLRSEMFEIEQSLQNLKEIDDPTKEQKELIKTLEKQLEVKKESLNETKKETDAIKQAREEEERREELEKRIKELKAEKEEKGGSFGSIFNADAREKRRELEAAQQELEGLGGSEEKTETSSGNQEGEGPVRRSRPTMGAEGDSNLLRPDMQGQADRLKESGDRVKELAEAMGIQGGNYQANLQGGVPVEINDKPVPDELYTEEERNKINAAEQARAAMPQAAMGGVFSGPETGFPAELHGTELVTPLDPNSILMELAQTNSSDTESGGDTETESTKKASETLERNADLTMEMMQMLSSKLDIMINELETSNEVSDQILKQSY